MTLLQMFGVAIMLVLGSIWIVNRIVYWLVRQPAMRHDRLLAEYKLARKRGDIAGADQIDAELRDLMNSRSN